MKLINIEDEPLLKTVSAGGLSAKALWRLVKSQRAIKAIPVEWIKEWLTKQTIPALHTCDYYEAVDMMLEDWEKENDR